MSLKEVQQDWKGYILTAVLAMLVASGGTYFAIGKDAVSRPEMSKQLAQIDNKIEKIFDRISYLDRRLSRQEGAADSR